MDLFSAVRTNLRDFQSFGFTALRRRMARFRSDPVFAINVRPYGRIHLRDGSSDLELARLVLVEGAYDVQWPPAARNRLEERYRSILAAGHTPVIVNAGGYIGLSALWFGRQWPQAEVVSIEPDPGNLQLLRLNLAGRPRQTILEAAIGSAPGKVALSGDPDGCAVQSERTDVGVDVVTMHEALASVRDGEPFICNIDIEGFEKDLFAANTDWIDSFALVIVEPHDWREPGAMLSQTFQRELAARPFEIYTRGDALFYLRA